jgi:hypothetical protein
MKFFKEVFCFMDFIFDPVKMLEENVTSSIRNKHVSDTLLGIEIYTYSTL